MTSELGTNRDSLIYRHVENKPLSLIYGQDRYTVPQFIHPGIANSSSERIFTQDQTVNSSRKSESQVQIDVIHHAKGDFSGLSDNNKHTTCKLGPPSSPSRRTAKAAAAAAAAAAIAR
jgi:hypothetical protein